MRHLRSVITLIGVAAILIVPVHSAIAQTSATAGAKSSTNASANSKPVSTQTKTDAQAKTEAATKAASQTKSEAQAKADAAAKTAAQTKAGIQSSANSQTDVKLDKPSWQVVLDKLFGTPDNGLLDGKSAFQFRAENLSLTADQAAAFFASSSTSTQDLAGLIEAAQALHGQVRMEGTIDGKPFELKLAGREMKIEGISLTAAQREALSTELRGISGLHEAKIDALVDGKATTMVIAGGKERLSLVKGDRPENGGSDKQKLERPGKIDIEHGASIDHRIEIDRGVRADTRVEQGVGIGRVIEKPELPRIGK